MATRAGGSGSRFVDNFPLNMCLQRANVETQMGLFVFIQAKIKFEKTRK